MTDKQKTAAEWAELLRSTGAEVFNSMFDIGNCSPAVDAQKVAEAVVMKQAMDQAYAQGQADMKERALEQLDLIEDPAILYSAIGALPIIERVEEVYKAATILSAATKGEPQ